ncbi:acid protease [Phlegmacium glaucopus]|nr:acid protease [Phlegmacium glaucopus]
MRYSLTAKRHFLSFILVLATEAFITNAWNPPSLSSRSDPIIIHIHANTNSEHSELRIRSPADNTTFGAGLTAVALSSDKQSYYAVIKTGLISLRVALDTASSDLWIVSSACGTDTCRKVPRYPLTYESPTFAAVNDNQTSFGAQYADNTFASGFVARETIELSNLTLANQVFGLITDSNVTLTDSASGIMGLGFPRLSSISTSGPNALPFFANLAQQGLLEYPIFALSLTTNASGTLTLGAVDSSVVTNVSQIGWNQVAQFPPFFAENNISSYLQWAIPLTGISVNSTQFTPLPTYTNSSQNHSLALFDVGTPGIYGPFQDVSRLYAMISDARLVDSSGQWAIPCSASVPLAFTFGERNYTLQPTDYIIGPASGNPDLCLTWPRALPPSSDGIDWQMGSAFLQTVYTIFSFGINGKEPPLIGLYPLHNASNLTETSDVVNAYLSLNSTPIATTLPNFILSTPTFTTPPYALNTSVSASIGGIVSSGLANSTYTTLFGERTTLANTSALPTINSTRQVVTLILTDAAGDVATTVSTIPAPTVTLGVPPGWSGNARSKFDIDVMSLAIIVGFVHFFWTFMFFSWANFIGIVI